MPAHEPRSAGDPAGFVLDLDGTISEPAEGIGRSLDHALRTRGHPPLDGSTLSRWIGPPLDVSFRALVPGADAVEVAALVAAYRDCYAATGHAQNVLYPGMPEAIDALRAVAPLALCTSKRVDFAHAILKLFGLHDRFAWIDGGDVGVAKTTQLVRLRDAGRVAADAVMIGDRSMDVTAAHAAGLASVGVLWGHGSRAELEEAGADVLVDAPQQLAAAAIALRARYRSG